MECLPQQTKVIPRIIDTLPHLDQRQRYVLALRERWDAALLQEGISTEKGAIVFSKIISAYGEVWRHYHNLEHLFEMFQALRQFDQSSHDSSAVIFAVLFHDFVYKPKANDNEERSALLCREHLSSLGVSESTINQAEELILLTKNHIKFSGGYTARVFIDADLMILSAPWEKYLKYAQNIRKEYAQIPADLYIDGRTIFLKNMLQAKQLYRQTEISERFDENARTNMRQELSLLATNPRELLGSPEQRLQYEWPSQVIAITGTIGSGKSSVLKELKEIGAYVVSADELVHLLYSRGSPLLPELIKLFGDKVINNDGNVDRDYLAKIVFSDVERKEQIEQLVHPLVHSLASKLFSEAISESKTFLVYEVPLLFENGLNALGFKKVVVVTASEEDCIHRIVARSGGRISEDLARSRILAQIPASEKAARADMVIENSGSLTELRQKCLAIW